MAERPAVISLGAGVQSSTLLLMAAAGEFEPMPELAIFADTRGEPAAVYEWLDFLHRAVGEIIPIERCSAGDLRADVESAAAGSTSRSSNPPLFMRNPDGSPGLSLRKCTRDYKVRPINRRLRARGYGPQNPVQQWLGISIDEVERMKDSGVAWQKNRWPLVERGISRAGCLAWLAEHNYPAPPKSACTFCPYHSDRAWRHQRDQAPADWEGSVEFDRTIRQLPGLNGEGFLHAQRVPLDEVDLSTPEDRGQIALLDGEQFANECEGHCGL